LLAGARFTAFMNDTEAASFYKDQADRIYSVLLKDHWAQSSSTNQILATTGRVSGAAAKKKLNLDASIILASNQVREWLEDEEDILQPWSGPMLLTALSLVSSMNNLYDINKNRSNYDGYAVAPGIGRYPEDSYDG
jgi:hypothetical protein